MSDKKTGGPAFPNHPETRIGMDSDWQGMTLRDYFAAKAMQGMITTSGAPCMNGLDGYEPILAKAAYKIADEMLKAREA